MFWKRKKKDRLSTPTQKHRVALGLQYEDGGQEAPVLSVKGEYLLADEIVKIARRYGVPVVEDEELAGALRGQELDEEIPEELYHAVAVVLHSLDGNKG